MSYKRYLSPGGVILGQHSTACFSDDLCRRRGNTIIKNGRGSTTSFQNLASPTGGVEPLAQNI